MMPAGLTCGRPPGSRRGVTLIETVVALGVLSAAVGLVAQLATWSLTERGRVEHRLGAVEAAANVLELARARPWDDLTPAWAAGQTFPDYLAPRMADGKLTARVEPEPGRPRVKRVTVEVRWGGAGPPTAERPVVLVGLFAARAAGGTP